MRPEKERTGTDSPGGYPRHLTLNWIPCAKKSRARACLIRGRVRFIPDKLVVKDTKAIQAIVGKPRYEKMGGLVEMLVRVFRPMSKAEAKRGTPNRRRGDTVSAHELVVDALQGLWYDDDSQIVKLRVEEIRDEGGPAMTVSACPLLASGLVKK